MIGGVSLTDKALLAKHLALLLKSGLTLTDALGVASESSRGPLKKVLQTVGRAVESGQTFSTALAVYPKVFPGFFINAVYVGESSGNLAGNLENISAELEKEKELTAKVKGAMVYPLVVLAIAFILGLALSFLVLPKIVPLFQGLKINLPWSTRALIGFSTLMESYGVYIFIGLVAFIIILIWLLRRNFLAPFTHWILARAPVIGRLTRDLNLARLTRTLGLLLKSGLNIVEALNIAEKSVGNYYYRRALRLAGQTVSGGGRLSAALGRSPDLFPLLLQKMIKVGEESGRFEDTLFYLSDFYEAELNKSTKNLSTALEPALLLVIGLAVAGLALAIITPIYELSGNLKR